MSTSTRIISRWQSYVLLTMCTTATFLDYATRVNINNAIVSMVHTNINSSSESSSFVSDYCPLPADHPINEQLSSANSSAIGIHSYVDETYDWDPTTQGAILGAFFYGYIILQIPAGRLAEIFGGKWIVFIGIFGSGIINLLTPIMTKNVSILIVSRVVLGLVQGGIYPAMFTMINKFLEPEMKSVGMGLCHVGGNFGVVVASTMTGYMSETIGWKASFYTFGTVGIIWTFVWHFAVNEKLWEAKLAERIKSDLKVSTSSPSLFDIPWCKILTNISVCACICGRFGASLAYLTLQTKLPGYLKDILHIEPSMNGVLNSLLYASTCISMICGSKLSEILIKKNVLSRTNTRKSFSGVGLIVCCICFVIVPSLGCDVVATVCILIVAISAYGLTAGGDMIIPAEMSIKYPSTIYSLCNTWANAAGTVAPIAIGGVLNMATDGHELKEQWDIVFYSVAGVVVITSIIFIGWAEAEYQNDIDNCLNGDGKDDERSDKNIGNTFDCET